jgi:hypothetical protein
VASGLVLVDLVFVSDAVNDRHSSSEGSLGRFLVAALDGQHYFLDVGAHGRAQAGVVITALVGLDGALFGLLGVGHVKTSVKIDAKSGRANMPPPPAAVKQNQPFRPRNHCAGRGRCVECALPDSGIYGEMAERFKAHAWKVCVR